MNLVGFKCDIAPWASIKAVRSTSPSGIRRQACPNTGCRFLTIDKAQALIDMLSSSACTELMDRNDLTIEPYDIAEHDRLITDYPLPSAWETPT